MATTTTGAFNEDQVCLPEHVGFRLDVQYQPKYEHRDSFVMLDECLPCTFRPGQIACFTYDRCPRWDPFIIVGMRFEGDKPTEFAVIFPRMIMSDDGKEILFGVDKTTQCEFHFKRQCICPEDPGCKDWACGCGFQHGAFLYDLTFKQVPRDYKYNVVKFGWGGDYIELPQDLASVENVPVWDKQGPLGQAQRKYRRELKKTQPIEKKEESPAKRIKLSAKEVDSNQLLSWNFYVYQRKHCGCPDCKTIKESILIATRDQILGLCAPEGVKFHSDKSAAWKIASIITPTIIDETRFHQATMYIRNQRYPEKKDEISKADIKMDKESKKPLFQWYFYTFRNLTLATRGKPLDQCTSDEIRILDPQSQHAEIARAENPLALSDVEFEKLMDQVLNHQVALWELLF